ncbi:hypothetical protein N7493_009825 [Penicillium malachiteum]|uniref:Uncharacterized protein n=1 Tax=Penicillium malachiteum TaxID=1324776 RepID=A0AAD6HDH9_9EURO|nr:hypothetical protein N7493_009825 [Penicillium malachiteum]
MQSSNNTSFPDRTRTQEPPAPTRASNDSSEDTHEKSWQPNMDRRQSWSNQDRKHLLQGRLLNMEDGRQMGFSEASHGH